MEVVVTYSSSLATILPILGYILVLRIFKPSDDQYLGKIPWVGRRKEWFASIRAKLRSVNHMYAMTFEGYDRVSP